jgi:hypothetical protein
MSEDLLLIFLLFFYTKLRPLFNGEGGLIKRKKNVYPREGVSGERAKDNSLRFNCSTGKAFSSQAWMPPARGRTLVIPTRLRNSAARALPTSLGQ